MKVNIVSTKIHNFLSAGDMECQIEEGITQVIGENKTDKYSESNGSGKSTIVESIIWALTGFTSRGIKADDVIRDGTNACFVTITVEIDSNIYEITRSRPGKIVIKENGIDISGNTIKKTQNIINELIPLTYEDLTTCIILAQDLPGKLSSQTPSGRKSTLESIANYEGEVEKVKGIVSNYKLKLEKQTSDISTKLIKLNTRIESKIESIEDINIKIEKEKELISNFEHKLIDWEHTKSKIELDNDSILKNKEIAIKEKEVINTKIDNLFKIKTDNKLEEKIKNQLWNHQHKRKELINYIEKNNKELKELEKKANDFNESKCHVCGNVISDITKLEELRLKNKNRIQELEQEVFNYKKEVELIEVELPILTTKVNDYKKRNNEFSTKVNRLRENISKLDRLININTKSIPEKPKLVNRLTEYTSQLEIISNEINVDKEECNSIKLKLDKMNDKIAIIQKIATDISRGIFRNYLLNKTMITFNNMLKAISLAIMKSSYVYLEFDGSKVNICYKNKKYEQMSGGERKRVDIAIELSKRKYKSTITGVNFNLLVMDEVTDSLDKPGINSVFDAVDVAGACESFMIISHRGDACINYDRRLKVIKENNISRLEIK